MYNLYYIDPFTGRQLLKANYATFKELKSAWLDPANRNYILKATQELPIFSLPTRPRHDFNNYG